MPHKDPAARRAYINARAARIRDGIHIPQRGNPRQSEPLVCPQCGSEFHRPIGNRKGPVNYCSRECMAAAYIGRFVGDAHPRFAGRITEPCANCGAPVSRPPWSASKEGEMTFCDYSCFGAWKANNWCGDGNPAWLGGHANYYGANWLRQARDARRRDGHVCQLCGIGEEKLRRALDVHHIKPFRFFGIGEYRKANSLKNLVSLCGTCHTTVEKVSVAGAHEDWLSLKAATRLRSQTRKDQPLARGTPVPDF